MLPTRAASLAVHVEAAKRLLQELEQHADAALQALGDDNSGDFFAAVNERDRVLARLDGVVDALAHERAHVDPEEAASEETSALLSEMARLTAAALESNEHLLTKTKRERDRLAAAINRASRPDGVATRYAVATSAPQPRTISVTG
jgi:hypothetical protein